MKKEGILLLPRCTDPGSRLESEVHWAETAGSDHVYCISVRLLLRRNIFKTLRSDHSAAEVGAI